MSFLEPRGWICNLQRFSLHDGPGIRTTVFFKGCTLRCFWCHNPEGLTARPEVQFMARRCIGCGACVAACPAQALRLEAGQRVFDRERCRVCGACVAVCYAEALALTAQELSAAEVVAQVLRDRAFYERSGGGVTLSGGEPAMQPEFARAILAGCRDAGLHTAIETAGHVPWEHLASLLPFCDLVLLDLKHMDPEKHRWATGVDNARILDNARRLAQTDLPLHFRTPVTPTVNDTPEEIAAIAAFVAEQAAARAARGAALPTLELLPFHRMAGEKYHSLGWAYRAAGLEPPSVDLLALLAEVAGGYGIAVLVGGDKSATAAVG